MKRILNAVLMLCIATMCTAPFEAQGQNRRTGENGSKTTTKEQAARSKSDSRPAQTQKPAQTQPQRQTQKQPAQTTQRPSQAQPAQKPTQQPAQTQRPTQAQKPAQTQKPAQPQNGRNNTTVGNPNQSHSAQISRKNSPVQKQVQKQAPKPAPKPAPREMRPAPKRTPAYVPRHTPPMPSYSYGNHYFGHRVRVLPRGYTVVPVGGVTYYLCNGIYYRVYPYGGYYVCRPPRGTVIARTLFDVALTTVAINTIRNEIQRASRAAAISSVYAAANTGYTVRSRDDYYNTNLVNQANQDYYYQDGVFYILQNGQYHVIEPPIGALVSEIPTDYEELELDGRTYYQVEETLYRTTVVDGVPYFEVVCNL